MKRILLSNLFALFCLCAIAQENQITIPSKITNVTVFISGAQVSRKTETIDIQQGVSTIVFAGLSSAIETQSIQAKGEGNFTILSVNQQKNYLLQKKNSDQRTSYLNTIAELDNKLALLKNEFDVNQAEEDMLRKNQEVIGPNISYDLVKLKQALDFQRQRLIEVKNRQLEITKEMATLRASQSKYNLQLRELDGKTLSNANDIIVKIEAKVATKAKFTLSYLVTNAAWYPTYDVRAKDVSSPVELVYKANVSQNSGEDWKNIRLTLSSGNPKTESVKPDLGVYNLGFLSAGYGYSVSSVSAIKMVSGRITGADDGQPLPGVSVRIKGSSIATSTDKDGNYVLQLPSGEQILTFSYIGYLSKEISVKSGVINVILDADSKSLNEVVVAGYGSDKRSNMVGSVSYIKKENKTSTSVEVNTKQNQTNVTFDIKNPYTILSDGKQFTVEIGDYDFKADFEYFAAPKVSDDAFLTAKINGFNDINLISGEANVFFEDTFLGKTLLDIQNSSDTLTISLGVDKNVVIRREKQKDFNERQFIGSSQKDSRSFVIDIKNRKTQSINLIVEDQIPVSTSSDITVERQEISKAKYDETTGKVVWQLTILPNEQKKLALKYQVKYPKNKPINIE